MSFLQKFKIGETISWNDVSEIHQTRHGIYQRNGVLISLLTDFGKINPCYPDAFDNRQETILYTGAGRRGDQKKDVYNQALLNAIESQVKVPLFCKIKVGSWRFLGFWQVLKGNYIFENNRMVWKFELKSCQKLEF